MRLHTLGGVGVGAVHGRLVTSSSRRIDGCIGDIQFDCDVSHRRDIAKGLDADGAEQAVSQGARRRAGRGLPRTGSLENIAAVIGVVLHGTREVGMPRAGAMHWRSAFKIIEAAVTIWHEQRHWGTGRLPKPNAAEPFDMIFFDALTPTTAISTLAAAEFSVDEFLIDKESGRKATHNGNASRAM